MRLGHRDRRGESRDQARDLEARGSGGLAGHDRFHLHQRDRTGQDHRRLLARVPPPFSGNALLQPHAVHAPAGGNPRAGDGSRSGGFRDGLRRPPPGQRGGSLQGHAEFHRESAGVLLRRHRHQDHDGGRLHGGRGRRADGPADRAADQRQLPHVGPGGAGHLGGHRPQPARGHSERPASRPLPGARLADADVRAQVARRKDRTGFLQEGGEGRREGDLGHRLEDAGISSGDEAQVRLG